MLHQTLRNHAQRISLSIILGVTALPVLAAPPPSLDVGFILAGGWQAATHPDYVNRFPTGAAVKEWQAKTATVVAGGDFGPKVNRTTLVLDYLYLQKLNFDPGLLEMALKLEAGRIGADYEDYFLHFSEDTQLAPKQPLDTSKANPLHGVPYIAGYTLTDTHSGNQFPRGRDAKMQAFARWRDGGSVFVYSFERFDEIHLALTVEENQPSGTLIAEIPVEIDGAGRVTQWQALPLEDETNGLKASGTLRFTPPKYWLAATTHDGSGQSYGGGAYFGDKLLRNGGRLYAMRLSWKPANGNINAKGPTLQRVTLRPILTPTEDGFMIRGWDAANDKNGDGYVGTDERAALINKRATARFRHEARAAPVDGTYAGGEGWGYANLFDPKVRAALARYYHSTWDAQGLGGGYNDEFFKRPEKAALGITKGGTLAEMPKLDIEGTDFAARYDIAFIQTFDALRGKPRRYHLSTNTAHYPLTKRGRDFGFTAALSSVLREDMLRVGNGLTGYSGLLMTADIGILAHLGIGNIIQAQIRDGHVVNFGQTKENWQKDHEALVAQAFLLNQPGQTVFSFWTTGYWYGNGLTSDKDFYTAGVPRIVAYYPEPYVDQDLGQPTNQVPKGKQAAPIFVRRGDNFIKVGDALSTEFTLPLDGKRRKMKTRPTGMFIAHERAEIDKAKNLRHDVVLGRLYEKGMVLFRSNMYGRDSRFLKAHLVAVDLPAPMRRVLPDGTTGPVISQIELSGFEGAILLNGK